MPFLPTFVDTRGKSELGRIMEAETTESCARG
jgi:hypothetical protein